MPRTKPKPVPWPVDNIERRETKTLTAYAKNPRTHTPGQIAQVARSIQQWGWTMPILIDEGGEVIAGHARLAAATQIGLREVPVMIAKGWTEGQRRAYIIADNQLALNSSWDRDLLGAELADLRGEGFDLTAIGFGASDIASLLAVQPKRGTPNDDDEDGDADPADEVPDPPRKAVAREGDVWLIGSHRLVCGDSTDPSVVEQALNGEAAGMLFTSPPYGNQRAYKTGGISDWDKLMQGIFSAASPKMKDDAQVLVNLGLIHREGEWLPYWEPWREWMREQGWRRFGWYVWDQGPALPGDWNGRLGPSFEFVFHFNRQARQANKIIPCKWAGTPNKGSGLRAADGTISEYQHAGQGVQETRIPDNVLRITRHKARGIETEHPAVFPVLLPEFVMHSFSEVGELCFEPFSGSGTSIIAAQRAGRRMAAIELAPTYVDVAIARWKQIFPAIPVTLESSGKSYEQISKTRNREIK